ncbi:hypothetical protein GOV12_03835 [Candidatus Pacearchaeota archaeon]|nr:hypothetical protein [Candidatus Pacearchaeota archaeon]
MNTINYELESKSGEYVEVSQDGYDVADRLVELALEGVETFWSEANSYDCIKDIGILSRIVSLFYLEPRTYEFGKKIDEVFLRICHYENQKDMQGSKRDSAIRIDSELMTMIIDLDQREE